MTNSNDKTIPFALKAMHFMFQHVTPVMPGIMARFAYSLWFKPPRVKTPKKEQIWADKAQESFITVDTQKIKIWRWGEGPTILFLHGWGGRGTQISGCIEQLNQAGFSVLSFDMPAHGQSDGKKTTVFKIVDVANEVIKGIDDLHGIITHSFGGIVFGHLYSTQLPLKKIVMICPPSDVHTAINQFSTMLQLPDSVQNYIENQLKEDFGQDIYDKLSLLENSKKINQPVLVIHDVDDDVVPFHDGEVVAKAINLGSFFATKRLGHRKILYNRLVGERIAQFSQN